MSTSGHLDQIKLSGFRSIQSIDLKLSSLNVLIGPNGAGKSNFINFFRFMHKLEQKDLQLFVAEQGGAEALLHFGRKSTPSLQASLAFNAHTYDFELIPTNDGRLVFKTDACDSTSLSTPGSDESGLPRASDATAEGRIAGYLQDWKVYHFHDTSSSAGVKQPCEVEDSEQLREQGENLAAFLYGIQQHAPDAYQRIINTIQRAAPFFQDFILAPDRYNSTRIRLRWKHKGNDAYFDAHSLSDGTLRFICLTTLLLQPELPSIILLDEPELGLHPYAIQLLASMLRSASERTQVIISTQSVTLANEFEAEQLIIVEHRENHSTFNKVDSDRLAAWLEDYHLGDLWEKNLLGGTP